LNDHLGFRIRQTCRFSRNCRLKDIRDTGLISAAAREMGMSYKRAWVPLDSINEAFTEPVVTAVPGRAGGGGASLT
jgi:molybdate transport system regulatory protein